MELAIAWEPEAFEPDAGEDFSPQPHILKVALAAVG